MIPDVLSPCQEFAATGGQLNAWYRARGRGSPALSAPVYHFTDTINLPWILASGALRPSLISNTGIGMTRFLWGTTNPLGDLTAGPFVRIHNERLAHRWRRGEFHLVRFTLAADEFLTWSEIVHASNWTPEEVAALVEDDQRRYGEYGHKRWRLRRDPIPLHRVLKVETTSFDDAETERWWPLDICPRRRGGVLLRPNDPKRKGVRIAGKRFYSVPVLDDCRFWYQPWTPPEERAPLYHTYDDYLADARYAESQDDNDWKYE